ncbi:hypothetical protein [Halorussus halophilus]|uniref:hypothetical protein n=1 Tax=Halorussus halophilus TaxID=2650975 RepID=UPI0013016FBC|nr:hypothetical protein [Halorussus halophilus]
MAMGMGHFAVGATGAIVLLLILGRYPWTTRNAVVVFASGVWAMLPDVDVLVPSLEPTDHTPLVDIFWSHYSLDTTAFTDSATGSILLVAVFLLVVGASLVIGEPRPQRKSNQ